MLLFLVIAGLLGSDVFFCYPPPASCPPLLSLLLLRIPRSTLEMSP
jgi:hypothetical protein